jgi:heme/copper-type cytochrome/quinol oxidase subunit 2
MDLIFSMLNVVYNDAAQPWQLGFQDSASPIFTGIEILHDTIGFYLIVILVAVLWVSFSIIYYFNKNENPIAYKYFTHGSIIELIWTVSPAFLLIAIAFPSFRLLYIMDDPQIIDYCFSLASISLKNIRCSSKDIIVHNELCNNIGLRFNRYSYISSNFPKKIISQLVGHLLGDGSIVYSKTSVNPKFVFTQTVKRFEYTFHVFNNLSFYCFRYPHYISSYRNNTYLPFFQVHTRNYPFLNHLYDLFYMKSENSIKKFISNDLILYLDDISLAYWAMDDGSSGGKSGFYLHTEGFSFEDCYKLAGILHYKFGLFVTVQKHNNKPMLYIKTKYMNIFIKLVSPYFHKSMLYKIKH